MTLNIVIHFSEIKSRQAPTSFFKGLVAYTKMTKKQNRKVYILVILILVLVSINYSSQPQSVVPSCFQKEDCKVPIRPGYCDVEYDCISGKCFSQQILCPELCYGNSDEDEDTLFDCDDPDCFDSEFCDCEDMSFVKCAIGRCYCEFGQPHWVVGETNWCACI